MPKNIYEYLYDEERKRPDLYSDLRIKIMLSMINGLGLKDKRILDIGCYDGTLLSLIKNRENEFYGIEASEYGFLRAKDRGIAVEKFFFRDGVPFPYKNEFFDLIIIGEIIEHIYDTDFFLSEIKRMIRKGGYLVVSTPNIASLGRRLMLLLGLNPIIETSPNEPGSSGHIRYFLRETLVNLLEKHGFKIDKITSDIMNFNNSGRFYSVKLAKIFPTLGRTLIVMAENIKK